MTDLSFLNSHNPDFDMLTHACHFELLNINLHLLINNIIYDIVYLNNHWGLKNF